MNCLVVLYDFERFRVSPPATDLLVAHTAPHGRLADYRSIVLDSEWL